MQQYLDAMKKAELEILKEFIAVCEKLDLRYYIVGGTLIGAVRHKGFIPWDDDIDVGMPREDYEVFLREAPKLLSGHLFVQTHETDPHYLNGFAKIRNSNTAFIERIVAKIPMNHGMFLDIFPLDIYEMDNHAALQKERNVLNDRLWLEMFQTKPRSPIGVLRNLYVKCRYPNVEKAFAAREKLCRCCTSGSYRANFYGAWGDKEIVPSEWYAEGTLLEFEGIMVRAPKEYDKWLTRVYGDYMQLPPVEKRVACHDAVVIDAEKSYKEYM